MNTPVIELAGLAVRAPVTALTNAMLASQCVAIATVLNDRPGSRRRLWALFFLFLGFGALAGVPKHGIPDGVLEGVRLAARVASNMGIGLATTVLVVLGIGGTVRSLMARRVLLGVAILQLAAFAALTVRHPAFTLVAANLALGLVLVAPGALRVLRRRSRTSVWVLAAIVTAFGGALLYLGEVRMNAWVDHNDASHGLVALALLLLYRAALADEGASWTA